MKISMEDMRFRRLVQHLHELGPRALGEFLVELGRPHGWRHEDAAYLATGNLLEKFGTLTAEMLAATGGDQWPPAPLHPAD